MLGVGAVLVVRAEGAEVGVDWFAVRDGASTSIALGRLDGVVGLLGFSNLAVTAGTGCGGGVFSVPTGAVELRLNEEGTRLPDGSRPCPPISSPSHPSPPDAIRGRCLPKRRRSVLLIEPYLSFPPDGGARVPEETDEVSGWVDRPDGTYRESTEGLDDEDEGASDSRLPREVGVASESPTIAPLGVLSNGVDGVTLGGSNRFANGDGLASLALSGVVGAVGFMVAISSGLGEADRVDNTEEELSLGADSPAASACAFLLASNLRKAFALAAASFSS